MKNMENLWFLEYVCMHATPVSPVPQAAWHRLWA